MFLNKEGLIPNLQLRFSNGLIKKIYINFMLNEILTSERIYLSIFTTKKITKNFCLILNFLKLFKK